ncbi:MAG TPA: STELLO glycosyltransferase family protein, partial [Flavisolibacter sp.]
TICPFNTQNTLVRKEFFALMYLPTYVTFRFTDILRSLIAQPIMWLNDCHLGFVDATVVQKRNPHDYFKDFVSEIPMYLHSDKIVDITTGAISSANSMHDNLYNAYEALLRHDIIEEKELPVLQAWLKDIS